jgi:hypothetical protein
MCTFQPRLRAAPKVLTSMRTKVEQLGDFVKPCGRTYSGHSQTALTRRSYSCSDLVGGPRRLGSARSSSPTRPFETLVNFSGAVMFLQPTDAGKRDGPARPDEGLHESSPQSSLDRRGHFSGLPKCVRCSHHFDLSHRNKASDTGALPAHGSFLNSQLIVTEPGVASLLIQLSSGQSR